MKNLLIIITIFFPLFISAQTDSTTVDLNQNWFKTNIVDGLEIYFAGVYGRPNDISDQTLKDDSGFTLGFKKRKIVKKNHAK